MDKIISAEEFNKRYGSVAPQASAPMTLSAQEFQAKYGEAPEAKPKGMGKASNILGGIFGGQKIGEAIGTKLAENKFNKSPLAGALTEQQKAETFNMPTGKQIAGDIGRVALNFAPVGKVASGISAGAKALGAGAKLAKPISQIATGGAVGYGADVTTKLAEGQEDPFKAGIGTAVGAGIGALPVVGKPLAKAVGKTLGGTLNLAGEVAVGSKGTQAVKTAVSKPSEIAKFNKGRTLRDTVTRIINAINKAQVESKKAFNTAIEMARDDIKLTPKKGISELNSVIKENPLYLETQEKTLVGKAKMLVKMWKDWSPKGMVKLRQELDRRGFYKGDDLHKNSDQIINSMRKKLNQMAISLDDTIAPALEKASFDIDMFNKLGYNILGKQKLSVDLTEKKLQQLLTDIDDPIKRQGVKELLEFLKSRTGEDIGSELQGLSAFLEFNKPLSSSSGIGLAQSLGKRLAQYPAMGLGKVNEAVKGKLPTVYKGQDISPGDVLFGKNNLN